MNFILFRSICLSKFAIICFAIGFNFHIYRRCKTPVFSNWLNFIKQRSIIVYVNFNEPYNYEIVLADEIVSLIETLIVRKFCSGFEQKALI